MMRQAIILATLLGADALGAQGYTRTAGDTVRYRSESSTRTIVEDPRGTVGTSNTTTEVVRFVFRPADSAVAILDTVDERWSFPGGALTGSATDLLHRPLAMRVDGRGRAQVVSVPAVTDSISRVVDIRYDLGDFLIRLPKEPLAVGSEWVDTVTLHTGTDVFKEDTRVVYHYRVARDTTDGDTPAFVITGTDDDSLTVTLRARRGMPATVSNVMGSGTTTAVFAPSIGQLLARDRTVDLNGTHQSFSGANVKVQPETVHYEQAIRRVASP
jgi:hypothetical protein